MKTCPSCGASVSDAAKFCGNCGKGITSPESRTCRVCGRELKPNDSFCTECGFGRNDMGPSDSSPVIPAYAPPPEAPRQKESYPEKPLDGRLNGPWTSPAYVPPPQTAPQNNGRSSDPLYTSMTHAGPEASGVKCRSCGRVLSVRRGRCESCGASVPINRRYDFSLGAGLILILGAILNLVIFVAGDIMSIDGEYSSFVMGVFMLGTIANLYAFWAGIQAIKRKHYDHCVAGYVFMTFGLSFFLTLPGLLLLTLSRHNFQGIAK